MVFHSRAAALPINMAFQLLRERLNKIKERVGKCFAKRQNSTSGLKD